jgi:hypothetical protein
MYLMEKDDFEKSSEANQRSTLAVAVYMPAAAAAAAAAKETRCCSLQLSPHLFRSASKSAMVFGTKKVFCLDKICKLEHP